jgi:predicted nucleic acid-binding protein
MTNPAFAQQLEFVSARRHADEAVVLAEAVRTGLQALYWDTLAEAYLLGQVTREQALEGLGAIVVGTVGILLRAYRMQIFRRDELGQAVDDLFERSSLRLNTAFRAYVRQMLAELP